MFKMLYYSLLL